MPLAQSLADFKISVAQCDNLIANAHRTEPTGKPILPMIDQQQITVAAFLNLFIAWEGFLESSLAALMIGEATINGQAPVKYVAPATLAAAKSLVIGVMRHFDYANHDNVRKIVGLYFHNSYPFEPHLSSIFSELSDLRTMRNGLHPVSQTPS